MHQKGTSLDMASDHTTCGRKSINSSLGTGGVSSLRSSKVSAVVFDLTPAQTCTKYFSEGAEVCLIQRHGRGKEYGHC